jgi:hypothetical protein
MYWIKLSSDEAGVDVGEIAGGYKAIIRKAKDCIKHSVEYVESCNERI